MVTTSGDAPTGRDLRSFTSDQRQSSLKRPLSTCTHSPTPGGLKGADRELSLFGRKTMYVRVCGGRRLHESQSSPPARSSGAGQWVLRRHSARTWSERERARRIAAALQERPETDWLAAPCSRAFVPMSHAFKPWASYIISLVRLQRRIQACLVGRAVLSARQRRLAQLGRQFGECETTQRCESADTALHMLHTKVLEHWEMFGEGELSLGGGWQAVSGGLGV